MSIDAQMAVELQAVENFAVLTAKRDGKKMLSITLIDLKTWVSVHGNEPQMFLGLLRKRDQMRASGLYAVTLWEDIWVKEQDIVKSRLSAMLGISQRIPARVTQVRRIDKPTADHFLHANHLQHAVSAKYKYGLYLPNRYFRVLNPDFPINRALPEILVAVATFSRPRIFERDKKPFRSYELIRFANLLHTTVTGGLDKLLTFFENDCKPDDIMTYADLEWSDGASYKRLGFEPVSDKAPIPAWLNTATLERFGKSKNTVNDNFIEVYNGGSRKFVREILASFAAL